LWECPWRFISVKKEQLVSWLHVLSWLPTTDSWRSVVVLTPFNQNLARFSSLK
jgi:hypothetical protein